jgi:hypothetical protein
MADVLPINFPIPTEAAITSYDYFDLAEGTGIVAFYGFATGITGGTYEYLLTTNSSQFSARKAYANHLDDTTLTFDVSFNQPKVLKGTAYIKIPFYFSLNSKTTSFEVTLYHYDGTTETAITSTIEGEDLVSSASGGEMQMLQEIIKLPITQTSFKSGDTLRLKIYTHTNDGNGRMYFSPSGTQIPAEVTLDADSRLILYLPFQIQQ